MGEPRDSQKARPRSLECFGALEDGAGESARVGAAAEEEDEDIVIVVRNRRAGSAGVMGRGSWSE